MITIYGLSSKDLNYRMLKGDHDTKHYLLILPKNKYSPLIKYRTANHFLPTETMRWQGNDISERKCPLCDKKEKI